MLPYLSRVPPIQATPAFSLTCFGVGDGQACGDRFHSSFLYQLGEASVLIDCGEPISRSFKASGLSYDRIDRIFLSHLHSDHVGGFFMLMQAFWLEQRGKPLTVHAPRDGIAPLRRMLRAGYLFDELFQFPLRFAGLKAGQPVRIGEARVTPFPTTHLERLRKSFQRKYPGSYAAFSFLIEAGGRRIAHSADLGAPEDLDPLLEKPVDLLVCELAHFTPQALFRYLRGKPVKRVVFIHVGGPFWKDLVATSRLAGKMLPGVNCTFARDGQTIQI